MMTIRGEGFSKGSIVRVMASTDGGVFKDLKPKKVKSNEIIVKLDSPVLEVLAKTNSISKPLPVLVFKNVLNVAVINPDEQKSNYEQIEIQRSTVQIHAETTPSPLKIKPGTREEISISINRGSWQGDIPLQIMGFMDHEIQQGGTQTTKQAPDIIGCAVVPAGELSIKLPIEVTSDAKPGKYKVHIFGENPIKRTDLSLSSPYVPTSAYEVVEIEVMGHDYECYTCKPFAPEIVEFQRTSENYIRILFKDNSSNEEGFRIRRAVPDGAWREIGAVDSSPSKSFGEFIDTNVVLDQGYNYVVEAWNVVGASQSLAHFANPPYHAPSGLTAMRGKNDFILTWMDNSENDPGMAILRRETSNPAAAWEVIRESCVPSYSDHQPCSFGTAGTGRIVQTDPSPNRNISTLYKIRAGDPNPETGLGAAYSEEFRVFPEDLALAIPSDLTIVNDGEDGHHIRWMDNASNEFRYLIFRYIKPADRFNNRVANLDAHIGTGWMEKRFPNDILPNDTVVHYDVVAWNPHQDGSDDYSLVSGSIHTAQLAVPEKPGTPVFSKVEPRSLTVKWKDNSNNEAGFKMERKRSGSDQWVDMGNLDAHSGTGDMEWKNIGLFPSTQYCYRVTAFNDGGSSRSREGCKTTLAAPGPELAIVSIRIDPTTLQAGTNAPFRLSYIVYNMGEVETGSFVNQLRIPDSKGKLKTENISMDTIPPNGYYFGQKNFPGGVPDGCYDFVITLDINNDVAEQSEQLGYIWDLTQTLYNPLNKAFIRNCWP
jgi:hypothetical protein